MHERQQSLRRSLAWFERSGVMRPADGFWGVGERIAVMRGNASADHINRMFANQTSVAPGVVVLEQRRPDCNMQVALLFDLAAEVLGEPRLRGVADLIVEYLLQRSGLRDGDPQSTTFGLWGWANPRYTGVYWTDDNAWVAMISLMLARRGRPHLRQIGVTAARALLPHATRYLQAFQAAGKPQRVDTFFKGLKLNPHWLGLVTMAFAHAAADDPDTDYAPVVRLYHELVQGGPRATGNESGAAPTGQGWTVSEYAYLSLTASVTAHRFNDPACHAAARMAIDALLRAQSEHGHFASEHDEAPKGQHLADLIYTQNWATLGLLHAARLYHDAPARAAAQRSLDLLARIQDRTPEPCFQGCWRGLYDISAGQWGGGDLHEGGQGSIYTGWTNAPIALAFLMELSDFNLLAPPAV